MILDRWENALRYLGLSPELDVSAASSLFRADARSACRGQPGGASRELTCSTPSANPRSSARPMTFEFHRRYADIHVPVTGARSASRCAPRPSRPADTAFDSRKGHRLLPRPRRQHGQGACIGWFCICFPEDAHVPCLSGAEEHAIVKLVLKVRAC